MPLRADAAEFMALLDEAFPDVGNSVTEAAEVRRLAAEQDAPEYAPTPVGRVEAREIPGEVDERPARVYLPVEQPAGEPLPIVMYIHGGGWVLSDLDTHDETCRNLSNIARVVVVSVHHRFADDVPFPAPLEDCYAMLQWTAEHAPDFGADPRRLAIAGDSSGGNLAAAAALVARDRGGPAIAHQLLIYPVMDNDFESPSYLENGSDYFITTTHMRWFWQQYIGDPDTTPSAYAAPLRAKDLKGLPPATIITAEYDPLRDEGEAYARRLEDTGGEVTLRRYDGMFHGFFTFPHLFKGSLEANEIEFAALGEMLRR